MFKAYIYERSKHAAKMLDAFPEIILAWHACSVHVFCMTYEQSDCGYELQYASGRW